MSSLSYSDHSAGVLSEKWIAFTQQKIISFISNEFNILCHADPLLLNDREIISYTKAVAR
jgi:hypothetical protein